MSFQKHVYRTPNEGQPLLTTLSAGCVTPKLEVKFSTLVKPFRYANSPMVPRYSVTCMLDPEEHPTFLEGIRCIENDEKVATILKSEHFRKNGETFYTGKILIKFQTKDQVPVYIFNNQGEKEQIVLEDELEEGQKISVIYDILRYTKKGTEKVEHGLSFKLCSILFYPSTELPLTEVEHG